MKRSATAIWRGGPRAGEGTVTTSSGVICNALYRTGTTAQDIPCTTPSEMLVAAEAACVSLTLAKELAEDGITAEAVETKAELVIFADKKIWDISEIRMEVKAHIPRMSKEKFQAAVTRAKQHCMISRALKPKITIKAEMVEIEQATTAAAAS
jgi:osmotically inducible protein OsmC